MTTPNTQPRLIQESAAMTAVVLLVALGFLAAYQLGQVLVTFILAVVVATAVGPLVDRLAQKGVPRWASGLLVFGVGCLAIAGLVVLTMPLLLSQVARLADGLPDLCQSIRAWASDGRHPTSYRLVRQLLPEGCALPKVHLPLFESGWRYLQWAESTLWTILVVLLLAYYWALERAFLLKGLTLAVPESRRVSVRSFVEAAEARVGAFVRGQVIVMASVGVITLIVYLPFRMPHAAPLAIVAGVLEIIPIVGPLVALAFAAGVALTADHSLIAVVLVLGVGMRLVVDYLISPLVMGRSVGVNSFLLLLTMAALASFGGIAGAMVAVPVAAIIQLSGERLLQQGDTLPAPLAGRRDGLSVLRYRSSTLLLSLRKRARRRPRPMATPEIDEQVELLAERTHHFLAQLEVTHKGEMQR